MPSNAIPLRPVIRLQKIQLAFRKARKLILWSIAAFFGFSILSVIVFRWAPIPGTPLMALRAMEEKSSPTRYDWKSLEEISPHLQLAVVCTEDQNFLKHNGFDFGAIQKAIKENETRRRKRGASTISQQVAKNVFLWPGRNYLRKGLEVYFTFLIEVFWSKQRIMEVYLNIAEMGDGIYGAEAAAQYYFRKPAIKLSKREAATLASILPSPRRYNAKKPSTYLNGRIEWTLQQMRFWGGKLDYDKEKKKKAKERGK